MCAVKCGCGWVRERVEVGQKEGESVDTRISIGGGAILADKGHPLAGFVGNQMHFTNPLTSPDVRGWATKCASHL